MRIVLANGYKGEEAILLQKALNELGGFSLSRDGSFGPGTKNSLTQWQRTKGYEADGRYDSSVHVEIAKLIEEKYIRVNMIDEYARAIGVDPAFMKAVTKVESLGSGFFNNGLCTILYERHIFFNQVVGKFGRSIANLWASKYPNICYQTRSQSAYLGGVREWDRLNDAKNLDSECALMSVSYGMFQIMGFNYEACGYASVGEYVADMLLSERYQLGAVCMLIKNKRPWHRAAVQKDFSEFARLYNGSDYAAHNYHGRLKDAYNYYASLQK